jgi:hypothetical protein
VRRSIRSHAASALGIRSRVAAGGVSAEVFMART